MRAVLLAVIALTLALAGWGLLSVMDVASSAQAARGGQAVVGNGWWTWPADQAFHIGYYGGLAAYWALGALLIAVAWSRR